MFLMGKTIVTLSWTLLLFFELFCRYALTKTIIIIINSISDKRIFSNKPFFVVVCVDEIENKNQFLSLYLWQNIQYYNTILYNEILILLVISKSLLKTQS